MRRGSFPWVTYLLVAGILWTSIVVTGLVLSEADVARYAWDSGDLEAGRAAPLFTSLFVHAGLLHLLFNLIALLAFGALLEETVGSFRYLLMYFLSGIGANLIHAAFVPGVPVVGASGAIFGVLGALVLLRPLVWTMVLFILPLPLLFASALYVALVPLLAAWDPHVAHAAHLAGMAVGMMGAVFLSPLRALRVLLSWAVVAVATFYGVTYATRLWLDRASVQALGAWDLALVVAPLVLAVLLVAFTHHRLARAGYAEG